MLGHNTSNVRDLNMRFHAQMSASWCVVGYTHHKKHEALCMEPPGTATALIGHRGCTPIKLCRFGDHVGSCGEKVVRALFSTAIQSGCEEQAKNFTKFESGTPEPNPPVLVRDVTPLGRTNPKMRHRAPCARFIRDQSGLLYNNLISTATRNPVLEYSVLVHS